jgi:hypothetical protein
MAGSSRKLDLTIHFTDLTFHIAYNNNNTSSLITTEIMSLDIPIIILIESQKLYCQYLTLLCHSVSA